MQYNEFIENHGHAPSREPPKRRDILVINVCLVILLIYKSATLKYSHKIGENLIF